MSQYWSPLCSQHKRGTINNPCSDYHPSKCADSQTAHALVNAAMADDLFACAVTTAATTTSAAPSTTSAPTTTPTGALKRDTHSRACRYITDMEAEEWHTPELIYRLCSCAATTTPPPTSLLVGFQVGGGYCQHVIATSAMDCAAMCSNNQLSGTPETVGSTALCPPSGGACNVYAFAAVDNHCLLGNLGIQPCNYNGNTLYQGACFTG